MSQTVWDQFGGSGYNDSPGPADTDEPAGGFDFGLGAQIALHLGSLADSVRRQQDRLDRQAATMPGNPSLAAQGTFPTSGDLFLDLGSPPLGRFWMMRFAVLGGQYLTSFGAVAGTGAIFVQGTKPTDLALANLHDFAYSLPLRGFYGTHQFPVNQGEHVWGVIIGGTPGVLYTAAAVVEDWPTSARGTFVE